MTDDQKQAGKIRDGLSAAYTCLSCGHRSMVAHGDGFKCRDCGAEERYDPAIEAEAIHFQDCGTGGGRWRG